MKPTKAFVVVENDFQRTSAQPSGMLAFVVLRGGELKLAGYPYGVFARGGRLYFKMAQNYGQLKEAWRRTPEEGQA